MKGFKMGSHRLFVTFMQFWNGESKVSFQVRQINILLTRNLINIHSEETIATAEIEGNFFFFDITQLCIYYNLSLWVIFEHPHNIKKENNT